MILPCIINSSVFVSSLLLFLPYWCIIRWRNSYELQALTIDAMYGFDCSHDFVSNKDMTTIHVEYLTIFRALWRLAMVKGFSL